MNRVIVTASLGLLALGGCHGRDHGDGASASKSRPEVVVTDARLVLPAVHGNPGAFYFTAANPGKRAVTLTGITVAGTGKAEMHETVGGEMKPLETLALAPGEVVRFQPGTRHAMVFDIQPYVKPGLELTVTFRFDNTTATAQAKVQSAGEAMGAMPGATMSGATMPAMDMDHMDHMDHAH
ncbi:MAG: copper chaperone PCu(A)C [Sphingomonadales bacterium]|nr:copper chaperone PCu(A)C [Sphingomonadales bacterium]